MKEKERTGERLGNDVREVKDVMRRLNSINGRRAFTRTMLIGFR